MREGERVKGERGTYLVERPVEGEGTPHAVYTVRFEDGRPQKGALHAYRLARIDRAEVERVRWDLDLRGRHTDPAIHAVVDCWESRGELFVVEPSFLDLTLAEFAGGPVRWLKTALDGVVQALGTLRSLHGQGVVHNDLRPATIRFDESGTRAYLTSFGHAFERDRCAHGSLERGTFPPEGDYVAPERRADLAKKSSEASDLYSMGVILHELATGARPGPWPLAGVKRAEGVPEALGGIVVSLLDPDPTKRIATAGRLQVAIASRVLGAVEQLTGDLDKTRHDDAPSEHASSPTAVHTRRAIDVIGAQEAASTVVPEDLETLTREAGPDLSTRIRASEADQPGPALVCVEGKVRGERFVLGSDLAEITIGRGSSVNITFDDHLLSRRHCAIRRQGSDQWWITDGGSRNGTFVNGQKIESCPIFHGDTIKIGTTVFSFDSGQGPGGASRTRQSDLFAETWRGLLAARSDPIGFRGLANELVLERLRPLLGYTVEETLPSPDFLCAYMVRTPRLWIRYTEFPILVLPPVADGVGLLEAIATQLATAKCHEYFALIFLVTESPVEVERASAAIRDSIYRTDFVVLAGAETAALFVANPVQALIGLIQRHGVDLGVLSPYITGSPVGDAMFVGREAEVKKIQQTLRTGNIALLGGRRIGKTSTLQKVHRLLRQDREFATLYFDCHPIPDYASLFTSLRYDGHQVPEGDDPLNFRAVVNKILESTGARRVALLFDEVDEIVDFDARQGGRLAKVFRALAQENRVRLVMSGERTFYRHLTRPESPFFNFAHRIRLDHLRPADVEAIVTRPMLQLGILTEALAPTVSSRIADFTAGHPYLVQDVCERVVQQANERAPSGGSVAPADLDAILASPQFLGEFKRTGLGTLNYLELFLLYGTIHHGLWERVFTKDELRALLDQAGVKYEEPELDGALAILDLFRVFRESGDPERPGWRFAIARLPDVIRKTEHVGRMLASCRSLLDSEGRHAIPSWGAYA